MTNEPNLMGSSSIENYETNGKNRALDPMVTSDSMIDHKQKKHQNSKVAPMANQGHTGKHPSRRDLHYDEQDSGDSSEDDPGYDWVKESMECVNTAGFEIKVKPNERFKNYKDVFNNLVVSSNIKTMYPMVSAAIAFDS